MQPRAGKTTACAGKTKACAGKTTACAASFKQPNSRSPWWSGQPLARQRLERVAAGRCLGEQNGQDFIDYFVQRFA